MSRIQQRFERCAREGRSALVPYFTGGDPTPARTVEIMHALVEGGADILEVGVPFSDPMADGPVIQEACSRALAAGTTPLKLLEVVATFRASDDETPVVLMGYTNTIEAHGYEAFMKQAAEAGVDGLLTVDLPPEEAGEAASLARSHGLDLIYLIAPNTSEERMARICQAASGFIYAVALKGVTGADTLDEASVARQVRAIRAATGLPVAIGFGVKDAASARAMARLADGVVVGSALVRTIGELGDVPDLADRLRAAAADLRGAIEEAATGREDAS